MLMEETSLALYGSEEWTVHFKIFCFVLFLFYWNLGVSYLVIASNTGNQFYQKFTLQG